MQESIAAIAALFATVDTSAVSSIEKIPQSGSDRVYYRIVAASGTYIATTNTNIKENQTFLQFTRHFESIGAPVPHVLAVSEDQTMYIQQDLGNESLLHQLETKGHTEEVYGLFQQSLAALAHLQIKGHQGFNYDWCITSSEFGKQAILSDLLYFKYYFLDTLKVPYDKEKLIDDFEMLSAYLSRVDHRFFMFRDFQSRNIMVKEGQVFFIDYQGGMKGALQYDVASLLWQAKAELSDEWKNSLLQYYISQVDVILQKPLDRVRFESQYNGYVLIRLLQVLGAYGFRGLFERKAHFLTSIPLALKNLQWFLQHKQVGISVPEFERLLEIITSETIIQRFVPPKANDQTPLVVEINSFSFKKGIPADDTDNGGGFVFDCRGILNPGRFEPYKKLSGLDKPVKDFLEQQTQMPAFLNSVYNLVDISVTDYLQRDFGHLMINFGCTGGQHRSVYAAEAIARHLRNKFNVRTIVQHTNQHNWVK